jgi:hypothetical protein
MKMSAEEIDAEEFVKYLENEKVYVKAHGTVNDVLKMYLYSYEVSTDTFFITELILDFRNQDCTYTIKSPKDNLITKYEEYFLKVIEPIL